MPAKGKPGADSGGRLARVPQGPAKSLSKREDLAGLVRDDIGELDFWLCLKQLSAEERVRLKLVLDLLREYRAIPLAIRGKSLDLAIALARYGSDALFQRLLQEDD